MTGYIPNELNKVRALVRILREQQQLNQSNNFRIDNEHFQEADIPEAERSLVLDRLSELGLIKPTGWFYIVTDKLGRQRGVIDIETSPQHLEEFDKETFSRKYELSYKNRTIYFLGTLIKIPEDTNQEYLCNIIFKDLIAMQKIWSWDEVLEEWNVVIEKEDWRKVYEAAREVNTKIATKTKIEDLLIATKKTVRVNPKYLE